MTTPSFSSKSLNGSEFTSIHRAGEPIRSALVELEGWTDAAGRLSRLDAVETEVLAATVGGDPVHGLVDFLMTGLSSGKPSSGALLERADDAVRHAEADPLVTRAIADVRRRLIDKLDNAVRHNWAALFAALDADLQAVVAEARELQPLGQLVSAESAIETKRVADYETFQELLSRHARVRRSQSQLMAKAFTSAAAVRPEQLYLADPADAFAQWSEYATLGYTEDEFGNPRPLTPPWPVDKAQGLTPEVAGGFEFLRWALNADVRLWVPGPANVKAAAKRLDRFAADRNTPLPRRSAASL